VIKEHKLFCNDHCATERSCPSCSKVVVGTALQAVGGIWHQDCFKCAKCGTSLGGKSFLTKDHAPDDPLCEKCGKVPKKDVAPKEAAIPDYSS